MEIVPGIHKIEGMWGVNCYLVIGDGQMFIVDSGLPGQALKTIRYVQKLGKNPADIRYILLTHGDIDHIGCARELRRLTGAKVAIHASDIPYLTGQRKFKTINNFLSPLVGLVMSTLRFQPLEPDIVLKGVDRIEGWQIVPAPGHTHGSICIYKPGQCIFVGDALRTNSQGMPRPISRRICLDLVQMRQSLSTIANLEYTALFPGHGAVIRSMASVKVREMYKRKYG
jgi:hydroxyacylglutathione hydrolase